MEIEKEEREKEREIARPSELSQCQVRLGSPIKFVHHAIVGSLSRQSPRLPGGRNFTEFTWLPGASGKNIRAFFISAISRCKERHAWDEDLVTGGANPTDGRGWTRRRESRRNIRRDFIIPDVDNNSNRAR